MSPPSGATQAPVVTGPDGDRLRVAAAVTGWAGLVGLLVSQLLPVGLALVAAAGLGAASWSSARLHSPSQLLARRVLSVSVLSGTGLYAVVSVQATLGQGGYDRGGIDQEQLAGLGPLLATMIAGLVIAHALLLTTCRDLFVALVIGLFMTVLAAGLAPGSVVAWPIAVGWPAAVAGMLFAHRVRERQACAAVVGADEWAGRTAGVRELPRIAAVVAVTVLVGVVSFLLLPQPEGLNVRSKLAAAFGSGQGATGSSTADGQPAPRDAAAYQGGSLDLRSRGALPGDPMLLVPDASPPLWRGDVLVDYDGTSWSSGSPALTPEPAVPELSVPPGPDDVTGAGATTRTDTVQRLAGFTGLVVAPGRIVSLQVDARTLQTGHSVRIWTDAVDAGTGSYTVTSEQPAATPAQLRQAGGPDQVEMANLELPGALPGRVVDLARQVTGTATTRYDKVRAVEAYLAANERYQLDSPVPAAGEDAVDDFLFVSHRGFCEQFASAETVLLRSVGVPARLVTGLAYGQAAPDGQRLFRASDSHAWVEVWYPGTGWVSSDPTAGASLAQDETGTSPMALLKRALSSWGGRLLLAVGLVLLATLLALGARALGRRRRPARATVGSSGAATGPLLAAFARLERALADTGRPRRPSDSLRDLAWRLPRSEATQRALATLERAVYGSRPLAADEALAAEQELDRLAEEVLAGADGVNVRGGTLR